MKDQVDEMNQKLFDMAADKSIDLASEIMGMVEDKIADYLKKDDGTIKSWKAFQGITYQILTGYCMGLCFGALESLGRSDYEKLFIDRVIEMGYATKKEVTKEVMRSDH